ncbi:MAG: hypothetical protein UX70_C0001G0349 [Candidatus Wolfebacteria bacterium GW2011_GWB1_47_1]|uniref:Uncharacterized protein n=1 Tax=Candidatus Wolfebacteria bacterium GW2011_GWB1_47_1 TaxID=1619007 RepID=A0A0G4AR83_9BACT|nr:MAG: hypothetical protein UX70_C0001G0349 [Candidatus Wolfebacteria bacterium GW2011_GWB1_47_1]
MATLTGMDHFSHRHVHAQYQSVHDCRLGLYYTILGHDLGKVALRFLFPIQAGWSRLRIQKWYWGVIFLIVFSLLALRGQFYLTFALYFPIIL